MSAKSSGGVLGTLVLIALAGWYRYSRWQEQKRVREFFSTPSSLSASSRSESKRSPSKDERLAEKAHVESMRAAGRRGDLDGAFAALTNVPGGTSAEYREGIKAGVDFIQRFNAFVAEFDARSPAEGLDLDLMLSPRFVCGVNGFEASLRRVDKAISFINELEAKMEEFLKEKDALPTAKVKGSNPFDLTLQWKRMTDAWTSSFEVSRQIAGLIKKLLILHRDHSRDWELDDGEVLYYDPYLCDQVDSAHAEILKLVKRQRQLENIMSATQKESFSKLGKAFDKAVSQ